MFRNYPHRGQVFAAEAQALAMEAGTGLTEAAPC
jgi:hypothetical protein